MAIIFSCSHCGRQLRVEEAHLGKMARCPACGTIMPVSTPQAHERPGVATESTVAGVGNGTEYALPVGGANELKIGRAFQETIDLYQANFWILVLASFLANVLMLGSCFLLIGPVSAGYYYMLLQALRRPDRRVQLEELFTGFRRFFGSLALGLLVSLAVVAGLALCVLPGLLLATWFMYAWLLFMDRGMGVFQSLGTSARIVNARSFGLHLLLQFLCVLIAAGAGSIPYLGIILAVFVMPLTGGPVVSAFVQVVDEDRAEVAQMAGKPVAWPLL